MAVYTQLSHNDLHEFLADFELGELTDLKGIDGGIENTNYFVTTTGAEKTPAADGAIQQTAQTEQHFVLTLFEELPQDEMPFFVELTRFLAERGVPVPAPLRDSNGIALKQLKQRPALLLPRFEGGQLAQVTPDACSQIGHALAKMHRAGSDFFMTRQAHRGVFWWRRESSRVAPRLSEEDAALLRDEVNSFDALRQQPWDLPQGIIHGDLFHDNALFHQGKLTGIIDLYNACTGYLLYDLAIVANDWCVEPDGQLDPARLDALLRAYAAVRPFTDDEHKAWPILLRSAAMRFWLSRLISLHGLEPTRYEGAQVIKDPDALKKILLAHRANPSSLPR